MLAKVLAVEQPRNYTHLLNPFQQGSAVQESRLSVFWREEREMSEMHKTINGLPKLSQQGHTVRRWQVPVYCIVTSSGCASRDSYSTRPGIADVPRSLRHFPGRSSHLFESDTIKSVVQVQEKKSLVLKANYDVAVRTLVKARSRVCRLFGPEQSARNSPTIVRRRCDSARMD